MTTLDFKPDPDNAYHRTVMMILLFTLLIIMAVGCKAKEESIRTEYVYLKDSSNVERKDSIINDLEHKYASQKEYTTVIENMLANTVRGTAGEKKNKLIPKEKQNLTLSAGSDSIKLQGIWEYIDYTWFKAPTSNIFKKERDSISNRLKSYEKQYKEVLKENKELKSKDKLSSKEVVKYRTSWRLLVFTFIGGFVSCFLIFNWGLISKGVSWLKKLF